MKIVLARKDNGMLIGGSGIWIDGADRREWGLGFGTEADVSEDSTATKRADSISRGRAPVQPRIPGMLKPCLGENCREG